MSLIDKSYFTGSLTIPQLSQPAVVDSLNVFIQRQEPLFLQAALGYELWEDFVGGLGESVIDQKWLNLRDGVTYDASGLWPPFQWQNYQYLNASRDWFIPLNPQRRMRWIGFCGGSPQPGSNNSQGSIKTLIVGKAGDNPVAGTNTYTSAALAGTQYWVERRPFGSLIQGDNVGGVITPANAEVSIINNGQTITLLKSGDVFATGEVFILHFVQIAPAGSPAIVYAAPLAEYVYYQWYIDNAANLSAFGVVQGKSENSTIANGMQKMYQAYWELARNMLKLWAYLDLTSTQDATVYPSYDRLKIDYQFFKPINPKGW